MQNEFAVQLVFSLASLLRGKGLIDAEEWVMKLIEAVSAATPEPEAKPAKSKSGFDPLKYINTLKRDQEDVSEIGLTAEFCEKFGVCSSLS